MSRPDPDRRVGELLRRQAAQHEPDSVRIRSRVDLDRNVPAGSGARPVLLRVGAPVGSAVAAAVVAVVAVLGVRIAGDPDRRPPAAASSPATSSPATPGPATPVPTGSPGSAGTATTRPGPSAPLPSLQPLPPPATRSAAPSATGTTASAAPTGAPRLDVQTVLAGHPVVLGNGDGLDWVVPGARPDGTVVRRQHPRAALAGPTVRLGPDGATGVPGPFRISWSGGAPEQNHLADTGWLALDPDGGAVDIQVPAGSGRRLTLYVGTAGADCVVRVSAGNGGTAVTVPAGTPAAVVTLSAGSGAGPLMVTLSGVRRTAGGRVGLAAVVLY